MSGKIQRADITPEAAAAAVKQAGHLRGAGQLLGCDEKTVANRLRNLPKPANQNERNEDTWAAEFDPNVVIPNKIKVLLAKMRELGPRWYWTEEELIENSQGELTQPIVSKYREKFAAHVVEASRGNKRAPTKVWFHDPAVAANVRARKK